MNKKKEHKQEKTPLKVRGFTIIAKIEFLEYLRDYGAEQTKVKYEMSPKELKYLKQKHQAYDSDKINREIYKLENKLTGTADFPPRDYPKQKVCIPQKMYFKCFTCGFTGSENNIEEVQEHIGRCKPTIGVRVFNLTANVEEKV